MQELESIVCLSLIQLDLCICVNRAGICLSLPESDGGIHRDMFPSLHHLRLITCVNCKCVCVCVCVNATGTYLPPLER
jgi:hypothetical protein